MKVLGVDPGLSGAIALIEDAKFANVTDLPTMARGKPIRRQRRNPKEGEPKTRLVQLNELNAAALVEIISMWEPDHAVIERAQPMQKPGEARQSLSAIGHYMEAYGVIKGVLAALSIPYTVIGAAQWKKRANLTGIPPKEAKETARMLAIRLFPQAASHLVRKKDHNRAESILLARFGYYDYIEQPTYTPRKRRDNMEQDDLQLKIG